MDDSILREKAREAMQNETLPAQIPNRIVGGPGCGAACALCGETLRRTQMELEPEFMCDGELHKYHLHPSCVIAWECERTKEGKTGQEPRAGLRELVLLPRT